MSKKIFTVLDSYSMVAQQLLNGYSTDLLDGCSTVARQVLAGISGVATAPKGFVTIMAKHVLLKMQTLSAVYNHVYNYNTKFSILFIQSKA